MKSFNNVALKKYLKTREVNKHEYQDSNESIKGWKDILFKLKSQQKGELNNNEMIAGMMKINDLKLVKYSSAFILNPNFLKLCIIDEMVKRVKAKVMKEIQGNRETQAKALAKLSMEKRIEAMKQMKANVKKKIMIEVQSRLAPIQKQLAAGQNKKSGSSDSGGNSKTEALRNRLNGLDRLLKSHGIEIENLEGFNQFGIVGDYLIMTKRNRILIKNLNKNVGNEQPEAEEEGREDQLSKSFEGNRTKDSENYNLMAAEEKAKLMQRKKANEIINMTRSQFEELPLSEHEGTIDILEISNKRNIVVTYSREDEKILTWSTSFSADRTFKMGVVSKIECKDMKVKAISFSPNDNFFTMFDEGGKMKIYDFEDMNERDQFSLNSKYQIPLEDPKKSDILATCMSRMYNDSRTKFERVIIVSEKVDLETPKNFIKIFNFQSVKKEGGDWLEPDLIQKIELEHEVRQIKIAGFENNRLVLMTSAERDNIQIWNFKSGQLEQQQVLSENKGRAKDISVAKNGRFILGSAEDNSIRIWGEFMETESGPVEDGEEPVVEYEYRQIDWKKVFDIFPEKFKVGNNSKWIVSKIKGGKFARILSIEEHLNMYEKNISLEDVKIQGEVTQMDESLDGKFILLVENDERVRLCKKGDKEASIKGSRQSTQVNKDDVLKSKNSNKDSQGEEEEGVGIIAKLLTVQTNSERPKNYLVKSNEEGELELINCNDYLDNPDTEEVITLKPVDIPSKRNRRRKTFIPFNKGQNYLAESHAEKNTRITSICIPLPLLKQKRVFAEKQRENILTGSQSGVITIFIRQGYRSNFTKNSNFVQFQSISLQEIISDFMQKKISKEIKIQYKKIGKELNERTIIVQAKEKVKGLMELSKSDLEVNSITMSRNRNVIACSNLMKQILIFDRPINTKGKYNILQVIENHSQPNCVELASDGTSMLYGCQDCYVRVFELRKEADNSFKFSIMQVIKDHKFPIRRLGLYDFDKFLLSQSDGNETFIWYKNGVFFEKEHEINSNPVSCIHANKRTNKAKITEIQKDEDSLKVYMVEKYMREDNELPKSGILMDILEKMFDNDQNIITPQVFEELVTYLKWLRSSNSDLYFNTFVHSGINILFLAINTYQADIVKVVLDEFGYKPLFYGEIDPFKEVIRGYPQLIIDVFSDYFEKSEQGRIRNMDEELFIEIMESESTKLKILAISTFFRNDNLVSFKFPDYLLLYKYFTELMLKSTSFRGDDRIEKRLQEISGSKRRAMLPGMKRMQVDYHVTGFRIDYSLSSPFVIKFLKNLENADDLILTGDAKAFVNKLWIKNSWFLILNFVINGYYIFYFLYMIAFRSQFWVTTVLFYMSSFFIFAYEAISLFQNVKRYLLIDFSNYADLVILFAILFYNPQLYSNYSPEAQDYSNTIVTIIMLLAGLRFISQLKIILPLRFLVAMITQSFFDMIPFSVIVFICITIFSLVDIQAKKSTVDDGSGSSRMLAESVSGKDFGSAILAMYSVSLGDWEKPKPPYSVVTVINFIFNTSFFNLLMINLLIAIISLTHNNFQDNRASISNRQSVKVLLEVAYVFRCFRKKKKVYKRYYLHYAKLTEDEE